MEWYLNLRPFKTNWKIKGRKQWKLIVWWKLLLKHPQDEGRQTHRRVYKRCDVRRLGKTLRGTYQWFLVIIISISRWVYPCIVWQSLIIPNTTRFCDFGWLSRGFTRITQGPWVKNYFWINKHTIIDSAILFSLFNNSDVVIIEK